MAQWILDADLSDSQNGLATYSIAVVDSSIVWIEGNYANSDSSFVARRTFYGWKKVPISDIRGLTIECIAAKDSIHVWIGTTNGRIYYTSNGGSYWTMLLNAGGSGFINDIKFSPIDGNYGYAFSDPPNGPDTPFKIYKTTSAGLNWSEYSVTFNGGYLGAGNSGCVTDSAHFWFGLSYGTSQLPQIAFTSNGGVTWQRSTLPGYTEFVGCVQFAYDNLFGLVNYEAIGGMPPSIYKTTNNCSTWNILYNVPTTTPLVKSLKWVNGTTVWYYCTNDKIGKSFDNGINWYVMGTLQGDDSFFGLDAFRNGNKIYAYAVTLNARVHKLIDTAYAIGIQPISLEIPVKYVLFQNYPNPFNPTTRISFDIPPSQGVRGVTKITVYDAAGRQIVILINEQLSPGTYEVVWDGTNYPSGVYFYQLSIGTEQLATKKMVLLK